MRVEHEPQAPRERGGLLHQAAGDGEGRARRDSDLDARARARLVQGAVEPLRLGQYGVDLLHELVRGKPTVRHAEVHRAARRDDADPELSRGLHLGLEDPLPPAREDVVVVEDGRAAREGELGEPCARRGVLGLRVDPGPDGIELAQPREEVGLLRARARQRLVQVVMRVDQPGGHDRAPQVDSRGVIRLRTAPGRDDHRAVDENPTVRVLGPGVVHRDDPPVRVERGHGG